MRRLSDDLTTAYMRRMRSALMDAGASDVDSDKYLDHFIPTTRPPAPTVTLSLDKPSAARPTAAHREFQSLEAKSVVNVSERNLLCMATQGTELVVGGADHSLRVFRLSACAAPRLTRELYTKRSGHSDWVTTVDFLEDGRIVSGGADSKICIWRGVTAKHLTEHAGSVSRVRAVGAKTIVSSSYDRSVKVWCAASGKLLSSLHGHSGAVLDFVIPDTSTVATCSRDSTVRLWELKQGKQVSCFVGHRGHVNAIAGLAGLILPGAQDGCVKGWDARARKQVFTQHVTDPGACITILETFVDNTGVYAVGSDTSVTALNADTLHVDAKWSGDHDNFIYSACALPGGKLLTGGGDGTLALRAASGAMEHKAALGKNALRAISVDSLGDCHCATDDGEIITV